MEDGKSEEHDTPGRKVEVAENYLSHLGNSIYDGPPPFDEFSGGVNDLFKDLVGEVGGGLAQFVSNLKASWKVKEQKLAALHRQLEEERSVLQNDRDALNLQRNDFEERQNELERRLADVQHTDFLKATSEDAVEAEPASAETDQEGMLELLISCDREIGWTLMPLFFDMPVTLSGPDGEKPAAGKLYRFSSAGYFAANGQDARTTDTEAADSLRPEAEADGDMPPLQDVPEARQQEVRLESNNVEAPVAMSGQEWLSSEDVAYITPARQESLMEPMPQRILMDGTGEDFECQGLYTLKEIPEEEERVHSPVTGGFKDACPASYEEFESFVHGNDLARQQDDSLLNASYEPVALQQGEFPLRAAESLVEDRQAEEPHGEPCPCRCSSTEALQANAQVPEGNLEEQTCQSVSGISAATSQSVDAVKAPVDMAGPQSQDSRRHWQSSEASFSEEEEKKREDAAKKIQSAERGRKARQEVDKKRQDPKKIQSHTARKMKKQSKVTFSSAENAGETEGASSTSDPAKSDRERWCDYEEPESGTLFSDQTRPSGSSWGSRKTWPAKRGDEDAAEAFPGLPKPATASAPRTSTVSPTSFKRSPSQPSSSPYESRSSSHTVQRQTSEQKDPKEVLRKYLAGTWIGGKGETYEIDFTTLQCKRCMPDGSFYAFKLEWLADENAVKWGMSFKLFTAELQANPARPVWHGMKRKGSNFQWQRHQQPPASNSTSRSTRNYR